MFEIKNNNIEFYKIQTLPDCKVDNKQSYSTSPAFRGRWDKALGKAGDFMNSIEKGGFLVLFLIQDFLGMTVPRTIAGFLRDKDETGEYNIQEGFEVLGREGLTGPAMMAVAPLSLWITSKTCGQSSSINSELIKRYGNSLQDIVSAKDFDRNLLKDSGKFKELFYRKNIENILKQTLGENNYTNESVEYIIKQLKNYEDIPKGTKISGLMGKSKYRTSCLENITTHINNLKYDTSAELELLRKVKLGSELRKDFKIFDTKNAFEGLIKYSNDAITANKKLEKLDGLLAESLKHKALGKRALINIGMVFTTLGLLSVLPKLYIRSNTAPGARKQKNHEQQNNISFKGKKTGIIEKIGKLFDKNKSSFVSSELEYNGHNFTNTLMSCLSIFGLLAPRCKKAYDRAQVDDKGKKDLTEIWEILLRDVTSSLAVVFAVPMLTRLCVTSYENKSGFVLMQKDRTQKSIFDKITGLLNPYSKARVLSNAELSALYDNITTKERFVNFCEFINKNGGNLQKILSKSESANELFNITGLKADELQKLSKSEANKQISDVIKNIEKHLKKSGKSIDKDSVNKFITNITKGLSKGGGGKITSFARGLNSIPGIITTFIISPYILGWVIPRLTYKNTRRIHEKQEHEKQMAEANNIKIKNFDV